MWISYPQYRFISWIDKCPDQCTDEEGVVCGTDGVDYHNECLLKHAACVEESDIKVDHAGSCLEDGNDEGEKDEKSQAFDTTGDDEEDDNNRQEDQEILKDEEKRDDIGKYLIESYFKINITL